MAHAIPPTKSTLTTFAEIMHRGFVKQAQQSGPTLMYALLMPRHTTLGAIELLELSPLQAIQIARIGNQLATIDLPGTKSLVMLPFSIPGTPYAHLKHMTLPKGTAALAMSSETWVHMVPRDENGNEIGDVDSVEPTTGWSTTVVAPRGKTVHLMSIEQEDGLAEREFTEVSGRTLVAMREVIIRSSR